MPLEAMAALRLQDPRLVTVLRRQAKRLMAKAEVQLAELPALWRRVKRQEETAARHLRGLAQEQAHQPTLLEAKVARLAELRPALRRALQDQAGLRWAK